MIFRKRPSRRDALSMDPNDPQRKGDEGEAAVAKSLNRHFGSSDNTAILHDLMIHHNGVTIQIDHLVLIPRIGGAWLVETKNLSGAYEICDDGTWMRPGGNRQTAIPSPIDQVKSAATVLRRWMIHNGYSRFSGICPILAIPNTLDINGIEHENEAFIVRYDGFDRFFTDYLDDMNLFEFFRVVYRMIFRSSSDNALMAQMADDLIKTDVETRRRMPPLPIRKATTPQSAGPAPKTNDDNLPTTTPDDFEIVEGVYAKRCKHGFAMKIRKDHPIQAIINKLAYGLGHYSNHFDNWIIREEALGEFERRIIEARRA